jgi:hypothetical protein
MEVAIASAAPEPGGSGPRKVLSCLKVPPSSVGFVKETIHAIPAKFEGTECLEGPDGRKSLEMPQT